MEAERLVAAGRSALAGSRGVPAVMAEAWQAQALARAVGGHLAEYGPAELRTEARELSGICASGSAVLDHPMVAAGAVRGAQLTEVEHVSKALAALALLLGEAGIALVGVACGTEEEGLYWQCIEAIDAVDESVDRVQGMLRRLAEHEQELDRERDGPFGVIHGPAGFATGQP
jgi:fructose-1,6-bisphosphatase/inositol monophosphatase family enzyme